MIKRKKCLIISISIISLLCISIYFIQMHLNIVIPFNLSFEQSEQNFIQYERAVNNAVTKHGYTIDKGSLEKDDNEIAQTFEIKKEGKYCSSITVLNNSGIEKFFLFYSSTYQNNKELKSFDIKMLLDAVNSVSGKEFTQDDCEKVFQEYHDGQADKDGFSTHVLNFMANWTISYWRDSPGNENLKLSGLTCGAIDKTIQ